MRSEYEVCVTVEAEYWTTVEAENEAEAAKIASDSWHYSDLQNGVATSVLFDRDGVYSA